MQQHETTSLFRKSGNRFCEQENALKKMKQNTSWPSHKSPSFSSVQSWHNQADHTGHGHNLSPDAKDPALELHYLPLDLLLNMRSWLVLAMNLVDAIIAKRIKERNIQHQTFDRINLLRLAGIDCHRLARQQGVSYEEAATQLAERYDLPTLSISANAKHYALTVRQERNQRIYALQTTGYTYRQIAQELNISPSTVSRVLKADKSRQSKAPVKV